MESNELAHRRRPHDLVMTTARQSPDSSLLLSRIERNLRVAMRFFGRATGTGEVRPLDRAEVVFSGLDYGVFNIAFLTTTLGSTRDLSDILEHCGAFYRE